MDNNTTPNLPPTDSSGKYQMEPDAPKTGMQKWLPFVGLACLLGLVVYLAMNTKVTKPTPKPTPSAMLEIKGSDTMVNLCQSWAEGYMLLDPNTPVSVTGGGSGTGIAAFTNGTCKLAATSRDLKSAETEAIKKAGFEPLLVKCALDGLAVCVPKTNPIESICFEDLKGIYTGKITDWAELGLPAGKIVACSRENNSGTYVFFKEHVLKDEAFYEKCLFLPSTKAMADELAGGSFGIGYGGIAYFSGNDKLKLVPVCLEKGGEAVAPSVESVQNGSYPLARPLYLLCDGKSDPKGPIGSFISYCLTTDGQVRVTDVGFVPLKVEQPVDPPAPVEEPETVTK